MMLQNYVRHLSLGSKTFLHIVIIQKNS